jgi:hypothetical protein
LVDLRRGSEDDIPLWNGVDKDNVGTFDSNGVFRLGEASSSLLEGSLEPEGEKLEQDEFSFNTKDNYLFSSTAVLPDSNGTNKSLDHRRAMSHPSSFFFKNVSNVTNSNRNDVDTFQWVYRDPSGNTQGPFSSLEMHNWFEAGYFDPALSVKREDSSFFESIAELIRKVKDPKAPFLATWPESHCTSMNNNKNSFSIDLFGSEGSTTSGGSSLFGNTPFIDRIPHQNNQDSSLLFNSNVNSSATKAPFGGGNLPPPLSHVNPIAHDLRTPLSPWERPLSNNSNGLSWLNSQNDPILNAERAPQASFNNRQQQEAMHPSSGYDYQQQQQMEQRYLHMLRQNQQQHIQLQQRMLLQQQHQQQFMMQQQQQHDMFIHTQQANAMSRGWSSVPGTPGAIEPNIQSLWGNHITNEVDKSTGMSSPLRSRSPPVVSMRKTEVEENRLNSVSDQLSEKLSTMYVEDTSQKEDQQKASQGKTLLMIEMSSL